MADFNNDIFSSEANDSKNKSANDNADSYVENNETTENNDTTDNTDEAQQYSSCYKPPYYVPNFTVINQEPPQKKKKGVNKLALSAIIAGGVIMLALICFMGYAVMNGVMNKSRENNAPVDLGGESIQLIQNSPQIEITQNPTEDYVPQSLPEVVSKVGNSVVEISTSSIQTDLFYGQYVTSGAGSGVLITQSSEAGYLLTNYHVIYDDDGTLADEIKVTLTNGVQYEATLVGSDETIDLALIRIEKNDDESFTIASFGKSSQLVVGQDVVAIGNPLGSLGGTVTDGIISALDRRVKIDGVEMVLLQHNAAINPGNSGGALFDMMGNLIGIVNAKTSESGIEGLGFAIPSDIAFNFINRIMVIEPAIGIRVQYGKLNRVVGLYVVETANSDFNKYDKIVKINGETVESAAHYYAVIDTLKSGDTVTITVTRNGVNTDIAVTLE